MTPSSSYIVIPARLKSTRLPRKMLLNETGKPLIQHTYESASNAGKPSGICVATDHGDIISAVQTFGGNALMTDPDAPSGTDRVAEVAKRMPEIDIFVNVQGDEPEIEPAAIDQVIRLLQEDPQANVATLATPIRARKVLADPNCVKVVASENTVGASSARRALYFSRSPIPFMRDVKEHSAAEEELLQQDPPQFLLHLGIYAYRRNFLLEIVQRPPAQLEQLEKLEQLRILSNGDAIALGVIENATPGVDTLEDYQAFVQRVSTTGVCHSSE